MDKKLKAKWVKALRSGKYMQERETLVGPNRAYCCLGVLSRLMNHRLPRTQLDYPPNDVLTKGQQMNLADMNDGSGAYEGLRHDFKQIADYIEANL